MSADKERQSDAILPLPGQHWVSRRKAAVVLAVHNGLISIEEICRRYELSREELDSWISAFDRYGVAGLRATRVQIYRDLGSHHAQRSPCADINRHDPSDESIASATRP